MQAGENIGRGHSQRWPMRLPDNGEIGVQFNSESMCPGDLARSLRSLARYARSLAFVLRASCGGATRFVWRCYALRVAVLRSSCGGATLFVWRCYALRVAVLITGEPISTNTDIDLARCGLIDVHLAIHRNESRASRFQLTLISTSPDVG